MKYSNERFDEIMQQISIGKLTSNECNNDNEGDDIGDMIRALWKEYSDKQAHSQNTTNNDSADSPNDSKSSYSAFFKSKYHSSCTESYSPSYSTNLNAHNVNKSANDYNYSYLYHWSRIGMMNQNTITLQSSLISTIVTDIGQNNRLDCQIDDIAHACHDDSDSSTTTHQELQQSRK